MKKIILTLLFITSFSFLFAQLDDTSSTNNGAMTLGDGTGKLYQFAGDQRGTDTTNQSQGGFGILTGAHQISPIVWMYGNTNRNAFQVRRKGYNATVQNAATLFHVGANGNVGIGTTTPLEKLHVAGTTTIDANIGTPVNSHWRTGSHTLELQNTDAGEVVLSFHRAGHSNASIRHTSSRGLIFSGSGALGSNHLQIKNNGNVGIGTTNPAAKLALNNSSDYNKILQFGADGPTHWYMGIGNANGDYFHVGDNSNKRLTIKKISGNVGIGTTNPKEKLTVRGKILCSEVEVVMENTIGADYVFQKYYTGASALKADYVMPSLEEVEAFTKANHHLPDVPSAATIKEDGLQLKEMTTLLLQKVEELTLYTIEQEKRIKSLETKLVEKN